MIEEQDEIENNNEENILKDALKSKKGSSLNISKKGSTLSANKKK